MSFLHPIKDKDLKEIKKALDKAQSELDDAKDEADTNEKILAYSVSSQALTDSPIKSNLQEKLKEMRLTASRKRISIFNNLITNLNKKIADLKKRE